MKTQILRLESSDDAVSIRDKLSWVKAPRVLLAFPKRRPPRLSRLDLTILQRSSIQMGGTLGLATIDRGTRILAIDLGIPVFPSISDSQRLPWRTSRGMRKIRPVRRYQDQTVDISHSRLINNTGRIAPNWLRVGMFALGITAFFMIVGLFLPFATIEINTPHNIKTDTMTIYPIVGFRTVLPNGRIPAVKLEVSVTGSMQAIATGVTQVGDSTASVKIFVANQTDKPVTIMPGSVFVAPGDTPIQYKTSKLVNLSAGPGSTGFVEAGAVEAGIQGNVPANTINAVEGPLGLLIHATNPEPATGGTSRGRQAASELDYAQLYDRLLTSLTDNAISNLEAEYGNDLIILGETVKVVRIVEDIRKPSPGTPADRIQLTLKVDFTSLAISREDIQSLASRVLDVKLDPEQFIIPSNYTITSLSAPKQLVPGRFSWEAAISREIEAKVETAKLKDMIKGTKIFVGQQTIKDYLQLEQAPTIKIWPSWWGYLPFLPFRMEVTVE